MFLQLPKEFFLFTEYMCILLVIIFFSYDNAYVICIFIFFPSVLSFIHPQMNKRRNLRGEDAGTAGHG